MSAVTGALPKLGAAWRRGSVPHLSSMGCWYIYIISHLLCIPRPTYLLCLALLQRPQRQLSNGRGLLEHQLQRTLPLRQPGSSLLLLPV